MDKPRVIKNYLDYLEQGSYGQIVELFTQDATISSPLYGSCEVKEFYKKLFEDTEASKIRLKNIFSSIEDHNIASAQFLYEWTRKDKTKAKFECVDVFDFLPGTNKIKHLTIIYDTCTVR